MIQSLHHGSGSVAPAPSGGEVSRSHQQIDQQEKSGAFQKILEQRLNRSEDLKFSIHAQERMRLRHIQMGMHDVERLKNGVDQIAQKGGRESLVLMDKSAFLVSVRNRTVITAMGSDHLKNNVFTNIDSTIIV